MMEEDISGWLKNDEVNGMRGEREKDRRAQLN